ncbi:anaerobic ribonucleoside triphosphate reductase [Irregularibacter muris]|uniref:Anaerobic ribonucleoside triphosphate reductase n=1 Tax=Irregularibacter muris TaxID=1796619 RepID=A0AAE3KZH8_9FIRM|nr:anaerobic ribonucleoside triphosphate reductase [Irregularibacter muris]MCR1898726.1 anaerobic ribonucleoside triphosphate reductase [Irregularibacter muris]
MIKEIKKRDGRVIFFNKDKITRAIFRAAESVAHNQGSHLDYDIAERLADEVTGYLSKKYIGKMPTVEEIQDVVEKVLIESGHAMTAKAYILYRNERNRIRDQNTRIMKTIRGITIDDAKENDTKRENANVNGNTAMGTMLLYGSTVSKEFCKMEMMNPVFERAHEQGDIHIHDMDFAPMGTLTCCQIDIERLFKNGFSTGHGFLRKPSNITTAAALAAIAIQANQNDQHGGQSIPNFDYALGHYVAKSFIRNYIENLGKGLDFCLGSQEGKNWAKTIIHKTIKETHTTPKLEIEETYLKEEYIRAKEELGDRIDENLWKRVQKTSHRQAFEETKEQTYQAMEAFIHNLNTMHSRAGAQVPFSSVNLGTDTSPEGRMVTENFLLATERGLGNGETAIFPISIFKVKKGVSFNSQDKNYDLFKLACRVSAKRLFPNFSFLDAPFNLQYYKEGRPETEVTYMGCRTRVIGNKYDANNEITYGRGNLSFTSLNLPKIALKINQEEDLKKTIHGLWKKALVSSGVQRENIYQEIVDLLSPQMEPTIDLIAEQLLERFEIQRAKKVKNFPFLMGQGIWKGSEDLQWEDTLDEVIKHGTLSMGFIGLAEFLKALVGSHHGESQEAQELGIKLIGYLRNKMEDYSQQYGLNFTLIATPAEGLSGRFVKLDRKEFGSIEGVTDREYYTNSFHIPVYYSITAFDKISKEAPYHALTNAGHISYIELDGDPSMNIEAFEDVVRLMADSGIGYGSINHPLDRDPVCGYNGIIFEECPKCGRKEGSQGIPFERIRRITGYLVGDYQTRFNDAKKAEVLDRVKHGMK